MGCKCFFDFLVEYYEEQVEEFGEKRTFEKYLAKLDINELMEIADSYGVKKYNEGAASWKLVYPNISLSDIPELSSLNR